MVTNQTATSIREFKLPDLGEGMHEAEIVEWLIKPGDTLKLDQTMVKVETDKAIVEIPSPVSGRVSEIRVPNGQVAKVGDVLVVFETPSSANVSNPTKNTTTSPATTSSPVQSPPTPTQPAPARPRVLAAPAVRKLAFELGVDLEQVTPSQPNGRVTIDDVRAYAERAKTTSTHPASSAPPAVAAPTTVGAGEEKGGVGELVSARPEELTSTTQENREPLKGLRKSIAEH